MHLIPSDVQWQHPAATLLRFCAGSVVGVACAARWCNRHTIGQHRVLMRCRSRVL